MLNENIKERIKEIRKYYQLNQDDFGKKLGITRSVVVNIELGRAPIKNLLIDHVCDIYSINKEWLLYGTGEMLKSTEQHLLNDLVKEFDLDEDELSIIKSYINLPKIQRKNFVSILKAMANPPDDEKTYQEKMQEVSTELLAEEQGKTSTVSTISNIQKEEKEA